MDIDLCYFERPSHVHLNKPLQIYSLAAATFRVVRPKELSPLTFKLSRLRIEGSSKKCLCCIIRLELPNATVIEVQQEREITDRD